MSSLPSVSIAMATYNGAKHLREQLDSFVYQTHLPKELVVRDDGSTDNTIAILETFAQDAPFPVTILTGERMGYADNFLTAARICTGKYLAYSDQDDVWLPEKLKYTVEMLEKEEALLILHRSEIVNGDLSATGELFPKIDVTRTYEPLHIDVYQIWPGHDMVFRRDLLDVMATENRPSYKKDRYQPIGHDHLAFLFATSLGKCIFSTEVLVKHRRHGDNVTRATEDKLTSEEKRFSRSVGNELERSLNAGEELYEYLRRMCEQRRDYLRRHAELFPQKAEAFQKAGMFYDDLMHLYEHRRNIYEASRSRWGKITNYFQLIGANGYRSKENGGLGGKAAVKDAVFALTR